MGTGNTLDSGMLGLSHVDMADVTAQVGLSAEYPHTQVASLVGGVGGVEGREGLLGQGAWFSS